MAPNIDMNMKWEDQNVVKVDSVWTVDGRPVVQAEPAYVKQPSNIPGMTYVGLKVTAPPNAATPPHYHGGAAVVATMIRGAMLNQTVCPDGSVEGPKIYESGDTWYEPPGCHHVRSENAGDEEAVFIANFVIETSKIEEKGMLAALVQIDAAVAEEKEGKGKGSL